MGQIKIGRMVLGSCGTNTYFIYREDEKRAIVVDPADYGNHIYDTLKKNGLQVAGIILTHGHFDHIWGVEALKKAAEEEQKEELLLYANEAEKELLSSAEMNISARAGRACTLKADVYLKDGQCVEISKIPFQMIATPGHTIGGCCYYFEEEGILISGDTLFQESIGRTDFATGSESQLIRSIREKLFCLPEETKVYPGHGDSTTIGNEKKYNPFCQM